MTFEKILNDLASKNISEQQACDEINMKDKMRVINYYAHFDDISKEPLKDNQLQELNAIVEILQILENSKIGSHISDNTYDSLQELLINMGIPRLTGTVEINDLNKVEHKFTKLRGSLDKVYYLTSTEKRTNKSRKYLDEWIKRIESIYERNTGKRIDMNNVRVILQPKFDGASTVLQIEDKFTWITRGDTRTNKASDITHIMNTFNDLYSHEENGTGIKYEIMMSEENKDKVNQLYRHRNYKNSRQIVTATINSNEADFKVDYLRPIPLRIIHPGDEVESIHPDLISKFPTKVCTFGDRDIIRQFANENRYVHVDGMRFRTDGVVMTILDKDIKLALGREDDINNFEVAYKFTEEVAYTKVKNVEFYVSDFGYITPVLVVNDVIMKGNTVNHISLSNKERFDELDLHYGDDIKILYDIIPYATIDEKCHRVKNGRKIEFTKECPKCHEPLDLNNVLVRCSNNKCPSRIIGRMLNYCTNLRIQNIGYQTLDVLYGVGLLDDGIPSLYKLKKKVHDIMNLEGFGKAKTKKIVSEIESKRKLIDYEFFGSLGIKGLSLKTFESIFANIKLSEFMNMIKLKNYDLIYAKLKSIGGIGAVTSQSIIEYLKDDKSHSELKKLLKEVTLYESYGFNEYTNGRIVFTGCRPSPELAQFLKSNGYESSSSWSASKTKYIVTTTSDYESDTINKARASGVPIITLDGNNPIDVLRSKIPNLK